MVSRKFTLFSFIVAMLLGIAGSAVAQNDSTTLLIWADNTRAPLLQELAPEVEAELGITLEVQEIGLGDARDQLLVAGPAGEGPDILISAHDSIGQFVANGAIEPLGDISADTLDGFYDSALNLFTYQDTLYGLPYAIENIALIRNTELVPEAPQTWQEVRELAEGFAAEEGAPEYAFIVQTGNTYHNFPITSAFGGYIFGRNDDGTFNVSDIGLASDGGFAAAEWLSGMYQNDLMPQDVDDDVAFQLFEDGDAAMFVTGPWWSDRIRETGVDYSIDPLPGAADGMETGAPFSGGQGFVVSSFISPEKQLLAKIFLEDFVATEEFMQAIFDEGGRPPAFAAVDTSSDENIADFIAAGENALPMPAIPEMNAVWASSDAALTLISQGEDPVESYTVAVEQIADAIEVQQSGALNSVTLVGSLQDEAGCGGDWDPTCETTFLEDQGDGVWTGTFTLPAGEYEYKVAMNADWAENYGADGEQDGANIVLTLEEETEVTFTYDHNTNMVVDSVSGS